MTAGSTARAVRDPDATSERRLTVAITGAAWPLGRRVMDALRSESSRFDIHDLDALDATARASRIGSVDVVIHLASGDHDALVARSKSAVEGTPDVLAFATRSSARHVVVVSSALVYGAWPNNPVPLTEDAPLRPDFGFAFARQLATVEQMVDDWRSEAPGRTATILRPVLTMASDGTSSLASALAAGMGGRMGEDDVPAQFLHLDDLAAAVVLASTAPMIGAESGSFSMDGVYNVAPDGFVPGSRVRALSGMTPRLRLPGRFAEIVADLQWRFQRGPIPPGLRPYVRSPWLVSNDRLRSVGWTPTVTNEQAFVEGTDAKWWTMMTPKRKQEIALGVAVVGVVAVMASVVSWVRRRRAFA